MNKTSDSFIVITLSRRLRHLMCFPTYINCLHSIACDVWDAGPAPPLPRSVMHAHAATARVELVLTLWFECKPWGIVGEARKQMVMTFFFSPKMANFLIELIGRLEQSLWLCALAPVSSSAYEWSFVKDAVCIFGCVYAKSAKKMDIDITVGSCNWQCCIGVRSLRV